MHEKYNAQSKRKPQNHGRIGVTSEVLRQEHQAYTAMDGSCNLGLKAGLQSVGDTLEDAVGADRTRWRNGERHVDEAQSRCRRRYFLRR